MATDLPPTGRPLDGPSAAQRVVQISALAQPVRLRILSVLVTSSEEDRTVARLAAALELDEDSIRQQVNVLIEAGLVCRSPGTAGIFMPTADAWIRFGRLLAVQEGAIKPAHVLGAAGSGEELPPVILKIVDRLAYRFSSFFSKETVHKYVTDSYGLLRDRASVTRHLPSLTSRFATDRLGALASSQGLTLNGSPEVLFVCVQNAGRSQIAAGLLRQLAGDRVHVRTAGSQPAAVVDEMVVEVLDEIGVPIMAEFPKPLTDEVVQASDVVITMGCGDACPIYPGRRYMDWPVEDPVGKTIEEVRAIRDEIQERVEELMRSLRLVKPDEL
jgi:arsenate reductase